MSHTDKLQVQPVKSVVHRRFSDFVTLRRALRNNHPYCILPPIPSKSAVWYALRQQHGSSPKRAINLVGQWLSSPDINVIDYRCSALELFLNHTLDHYRLAADPLISQFLCCDIIDWRSYPLPSSCSSESSSNPQMYSDHSPSCLMIPNGISTPVLKSSYINSTLLTIRASGLKTAFEHLHKNHSHLNIQATQTHRLYRGYTDSLCRWSTCEKSDKSCADALQVMGHELDNYASAMDGVNEYAVEWVERGHILSNYSSSLTELHRAYQEKQKQQPVLTSCSPRTPRESTGPSSLDDKIPTPSRNAESLSQIAGNILIEVTQFEGVCNRDLESIFHTYAVMQLRYAERCRRTWERIHLKLNEAIEQMENTSGTPTI